MILEIHSNQIKVIDQNSFVYFNHLYTVNLKYNKIRAISFNLYKGESIKLSSNFMYIVSKEALKYLNNCQELCLADNKIYVIEPFTLQDMRNLAGLNLKQNNISSIKPNGLWAFLILKNYTYRET